MNKRIKKLWIKALLSGKYKQGRNGLRKQDREGVDHFCCLGVLCDLHAKATNKKWVKQRSGTYFSYKEKSGYLPNVVIKWAGLNDDRATLPRENFQYGYGTALSNLNDQGNSFTEIAKVIEEKF